MEHPRYTSTNERPEVVERSMTPSALVKRWEGIIDLFETAPEVAKSRELLV